MRKLILLFTSLAISPCTSYAGKEAKWIFAREENCRALYEVVYSDGEITLPDNCNDSPAFAGGHATHTYYGAVKDPGISASAFSKVSKATCINKEPLDYEEFKAVVCKNQRR